MDILIFILQSIYIILPGAFANMAPVLFKKVNFLNYPVDFNKKWKNKPLFGKNKTFRGFFFGILLAIVVVFIQKQLFSIEAFRTVSLINYSQINFVLLGFLFGFGVLFGDLVESLIKRRLNIKPGARFFPWDQLDCLIGGLIFLSFVYVPPLSVIIFLVIIVPAFHVAINHIGFYLKLKDTKW